MEPTHPIDFETNTPEHVLLRREGAIATITLNRPERRNALSYAANRRLHALWEEIDADPTIRAVILTSADCGTFCAGMDLKEAAELRARTGQDILQLLQDPFYERMRTVRVPIIAAMTGHFTAAGMVLAANADLRVALAGTSGGITEARVGRGTPWAAPMVAMLPLAVLMELATTAHPLPVERLHALGFINVLAATPAAVREKAADYARAIAANAPLSVAAAKAGLLASVDLGAHAGYALSKAQHREVYASEDAVEGPRAFAEKRAPRWQAR
ncbi:enoyl-CoA hydratase/isomerase family protein [Bordetella sp. BOR01]|uniref:enoyl-CoA hydratase/isomerase family protein n=1 Tax=Bordetella sp. BOR01 TaxID=2854779 RepID=UPI001C43D032|nr:enoyl-CoA hydratase-related protein [Bordetella sp. BOR01]MBV7485343.1 enoyl-CoA hydratase/isomerase family protein [Bordetella sp. BOR01]